LGGPSRASSASKSSLSPTKASAFGRFFPIQVSAVLRTTLSHQARGFSGAVASSAASARIAASCTMSSASGPLPLNHFASP
jgi:hypothetical protein